MKVKEESEKAGLKLIIEKLRSWHRGENGERRKEPWRGSMYKEQQESGQPPSKSRSELAHEGVDENSS